MPERKTVLITGSSRGIGKTIARKFAERNFNVIINCRKSSDKLKEFEAQLKEYNDNILSFVCDVSKYEDVRKMINEINLYFGGIDILVNNAGISYIGLFNEMKYNMWDDIIDVNLKGVYNCTHLVLPYMINKKKGSVVNISSVWGDRGASCEVIYSSTKGAVNSFTKALAKELGPCDIKVNAIACGVIDTEMNAFLSEEEKKTLIDEIPFTRFGRAEEVAELVYFLASDNSSYLSGQVIAVDGAWI
ncbi:MAG: SDR family oxidoreductase [Clostridiales bacterium]|jgi:3-oxoacyl-[acyl-carrier protein] reductase|nr:SDR family oxidoreductase [Clostridiales bacterium]